MKKSITFIIGLMLSLGLQSQIDYAIKFKITAPNGYTDETIIRLEHTATQNFDGQWDAWKMFTWNDSVPSLYSFSADSFAFATNTIPFMEKDSSMFLTMRVPLVGGSFLMETEQLGAFPPGIKVAIRDLETNAIYDLCTNQTFSFNADSSSSDFDRFELFYSTSATADTVLNSVIIQNLGSTNWSYDILDAFSVNVSSGGVSSESIQIVDLEIGTYTTLVTDQYGLVDTLFFEVTVGDSTDEDPPINTSGIYEATMNFSIYQNLGQNYLSMDGCTADSEIQITYYSFNGGLLRTESIQGQQDQKLLFSCGHPMLIVVQSDQFQKTFKVLN